MGVAGKLVHLKELLLGVFEPNDVIDRIPQFNFNEVGSKIRDQSQQSRERRVMIFIEYLQNVQIEDSSIFDQFLAVLGSSPYEYLVPLLSDDFPCGNIVSSLRSVQKTDKIKRLFRVIYPGLKDISPRNILPYLDGHLSVRDIEELEETVQRCSNSHGLYALLDKLVIKPPEWVKTFIDAIEDLNYNAANPMFEDFDHNSLAVALREFIECFPEGSESDMDVQMSFSESVEQGNDAQLQICRPMESPMCSSNVGGGSETMDAPPGKRMKFPSATTMNFPPEQHTSWKLRNYQLELCKLANNGESVIICAPTNSGKTVMAASIIQQHMLAGGRKVAFFAPTGGLAGQQHDKLQKYLPEMEVVLIRGNMVKETVNFDLSKTIFTNNVIVMTPQIVLNALQHKSLDSVFDFSLMIFDECHHTRKSHPYHRILINYLEKKSVTKKNLQIIGLTATLGVGDAKNLDEAIKHIISLCGSLDAHGGVVTVKKEENVDELNRFCPETAEETIPILKDDDNPLKKHIQNTKICVIELFQKNGGFSNLPQIAFPTQGTLSNFQEFQDWCSKVENHAVQWKDTNGETFGRDSKSCVEALKKLNEAMDIVSVCRPVDGIQVLRKFIDEFYHEQETENTKIEDELRRMLKDALSKMESYPLKMKIHNANLDLMEDIILKKVSEASSGDKNHPRIMTMVAKRIHAVHLQKWMHESDTLKELKARVFIGIGKKNTLDSPGMSHNEQTKVLDDFRKGETMAIICTPDAAGEGMDIQDCNLVINYDFMRNEIQKVQTVGRARRSDSTVVQLSSERVEERDKLNLVKILLMNQATREVQKIKKRNLEDFRMMLIGTQRISLEKMRNADLKRQKTPNRSCGNFEIKCRKCSAFACFSGDIIRLNGDHHTVTDKEFNQRFQTYDLESVGWSGSNEFKRESRIKCKECRHNWGNISRWKNFSVPVLNIKGFKVIDSEGCIKQPKQWKWVPFVLRDGNMEEMCVELRYLSRPSESHW